MGKKIYNFVLRKDWEKLARKLRGPLPSLDNPNVREPQDDPDDVVCEPDAAGMTCIHQPSNRSVSSLVICMYSTAVCTDCRGVSTLHHHVVTTTTTTKWKAVYTKALWNSPIIKKISTFTELFVPYFENAKWNDKVQFSVRMQCNLIRRGNSSKTTSFQVSCGDKEAREY